MGGEGEWLEMQLPGMPRWMSSASQPGSSLILMQGVSLEGTACPRQLNARHRAPVNKRPSHHPSHAAKGERQLGTRSLHGLRLWIFISALRCAVAHQGPRDVLI